VEQAEEQGEVAAILVAGAAAREVAEVWAVVAVVDWAGAMVAPVAVAPAARELAAGQPGRQGA
jgi:hypothetical protein